MPDAFFERPILNSPYERPARNRELDAHGQPTQQIIESRRPAEFITPIPKPRKRKGAVEQQRLVFDEGAGVSSIWPMRTPLPRRQRSVRGAQDHAQGGDRRGRVGDAARGHVAAVAKPSSGRIAVKVINHLGDEVMKVFCVE
jgi:hypothetical protein